MREQWLTTYEQCTTGQAWYATNVMTAHQPPQTLSTPMASRTVSSQGRRFPMSWSLQSNYLQEAGKVILSQLGV